MLVLVLAVAAAGPVAAQTITGARYTQPVSRYGHAALGARHEWGALVIHLQDGRNLRFTLSDALVFEDTAPRVGDLDGDGQPEVVVVESSLGQGSRLAVYSAQGRIAATAPIGTHNRWLAPVGIADLDGDGRVEIAYVETPHQGGILKLVQLTDDGLKQVAQAAGLTNHRFGDGFIQGGIAACGDHPVLLTAYADWSRVIATRWVGGKLLSADLGRYTGPRSFDAALNCR